MVGAQPVLEESGHFGTGPSVCNHPARFSLENIGLFEFARGGQIIKCLIGQAIPQGECQMGRDGMVIGLSLEFRIEEPRRFQNGKHGSACAGFRVGRSGKISIDVERLNLRADGSAERPCCKQATKCLEFVGTVGIGWFRFGEVIDLVHDCGCGFKRTIRCRLVPCF